LITELGLAPERFAFLKSVEQSHFWFVARRYLVEGLVNRAITEPVDLLIDVGCGPGLNLATWRSLAKTVVGIDQQVMTTGSASEDIRIGDADKLPFADSAVDVVLLLDVLEHVDDESALREANRVLRGGGNLVVAVPAHPWLWGARDIGAHHLRRYSLRTLKTRLSAAGFEIVTLRPYQFLLFPAVALSRLFGKVSPAARDLEDRPQRALNAVLSLINRFEVWLSLKVGPMPTGSSYIAVARKRS